MVITICGSNAFKEKMLEYKKLLKEAGHEAIVRPDYEAFIKGEKQDVWQLVENGEHARVKKENGYIKWYYDAIVRSDAILVLNFDKKDIQNYIGGNTLMEMGFAHVNDKKIFLLNSVPEVSYKDEILAMFTKILNGDLNKIS